MRRCADLMTELCRLKFKITLQSQGIYPWISCPLHISWTLWKIFIKLWTNVHLSKTVYKTYNSAMQTQGQYHSLRSLDLPLNTSRSLYISCTLWKIFINFSQIYISVRRCAEPMHQLRRCNVKGHSYRYWEFRLLDPWKDFHLTLVNCSSQWDGVQNP